MVVSFSQNTLFFFFLAGFIVAMALGVLFIRNTIGALLFLVVSMLAIGVLFLAQGAVFLGSMQLVVYTGVIMTLFLKVFMSVDIDKITYKALKEKPFIGKFIKVGAVGAILGLSLGAFSLKTYTNFYQKDLSIMSLVENLMLMLFTSYIFVFKIMGVFILVISVAVMSVNKLEKD